MVWNVVLFAVSSVPEGLHDSPGDLDPKGDGVTKVIPLSAGSRLPPSGQKSAGRKYRLTNGDQLPAVIRLSRSSQTNISNRKYNLLLSTFTEVDFSYFYSPTRICLSALMKPCRRRNYRKARNCSLCMYLVIRLGTPLHIRPLPAPLPRPQPSSPPLPSPIPLLRAVIRMCVCVTP